MRRLLLACLIAATGFACADIIDIDNAQLDKLTKSGVPVVNIRLQSEWEETGIVAGSKLLTSSMKKAAPMPPAGWRRSSSASPQKYIHLQINVRFYSFTVD